MWKCPTERGHFQLSPALLDHLVARWASMPAMTFRDLPIEEQAEMMAAYLTEQQMRGAESFDHAQKAKTRHRASMGKV